MAIEDDSASSDSSSVGVVDLNEDREWQDAEDDVEKVTFVSLFDDATFTNLPAMLAYCKERHQFDLEGLVKSLALDFFSVLKLVNFVRHEVKSGNKAIAIASKDVFDDDKYLQPVLDDDAVLFSIDELSPVEADADVDGDPLVITDNDPHAQVQRILELEQKLRSVQQEYANYRQSVEQTLQSKWNQDLSQIDSGTAPGPPPQTEQDKFDRGYFDSYAYNDIHETMIKDSVRTDAYRDFIYDNKDVFQGKVVLDVGCGTGILSMFCAKAGAAKVIAVDNSAIIDKARENVYENGLADKITCLRGKIEEVTLPVPQVDIIVSEWMGYCLLFEAMLDSVLWARDRYLRPDGLMVPSHCTLHIAPIADEDDAAANISFWDDVYGFSMTSMRDKNKDDVLVRQLDPKNVLNASSVFRTLPLHSVSVSDLSFKAPFEAALPTGLESIHGWTVWFDTFFLRSRDDTLPDNINAVDFSASGRKGVAFTTGPFGKETHWKSGVMPIDERNRSRRPEGEAEAVVKGNISYRKGQQDSRALDIDVDWIVAGAEYKQTWFLR